MASIAAALVGCATILGIEDRPLRQESDASDASSESAPAEAGGDASCNRFESRACTADCPREFCDDFDGDGQAPTTRWRTPIGFNNPFVRGDSGVTLTANGNSAPTALSAGSGSAGQTAYAFLAHLLAFDETHPGETFGGVRVAIDLRVDSLTISGKGGPVPDAGSAALLGMTRSDVVPPKGLAIVVSGTSMYLSIAEDVLGGTGTSVLGRITDQVDIVDFLRSTWLQVELFVGERDIAVKLGYSKCAEPTITPGQVAVAAVGARKIGMACLNVPDAFGPPTWPKSAVILGGTLLFAAGESKFRIDNVAADFFTK
ncbi:MAG: hypothetical protein JST00_18400 [Deltaproteobacteria bacterium]|nr:hypothetical protein [Deltaproteobacteria bacterium]